MTLTANNVLSHVVIQKILTMAFAKCQTVEPRHSPKCLIGSKQQEGCIWHVRKAEYFYISSLTVLKEKCLPCEDSQRVQ